MFRMASSSGECSSRPIADVLHLSGVKGAVQVNYEGKAFTRLVAAPMSEDPPGAYVDAASQIKRA